MNAKGTPGNLKNFVKGDARINRKGKPRSFDALRKLAQQIAHDEIGANGMTVTEAILRKWAGSNDPRLQIQFMEVSFGKVPIPVENEHNGKIVHEIVVSRGKNSTSHRVNPAASGAIDGSGDREALQCLVNGTQMGQDDFGD